MPNIYVGHIMTHVISGVSDFVMVEILGNTVVHESHCKRVAVRGGWSTVGDSASPSLKLWSTI